MINIKNDILIFLSLILASIFIHYYLPSLLGYIWFILLLIGFLISKNRYNYLWIVLFLLLFSSPGYLFYERGIYNLPIISLPGFDRAIIYSELFAILAIIKALIYPVKQNIFYREPLLILIGYSIFLLFLGLIMGMGIFTFLKSIRYFFPILLLLLLPRLIPYHNVPNTIVLLFISAIILVFAQYFDVIFGYPIAFILGETKIMFSGQEVGEDLRTFDVTIGPVRTIYGPFILLLSIVSGIAILVEKKVKLEPLYIYIVISIATLGILTSAVRGWVIGVALIFSGIAYIKKYNFGIYLFTILLILIVLLSVPNISLQIEQAINRIMTIESLVKGDLTADGTLKRLTERGPRVMNKYWQSPIFGFGFSDEYYEYSDSHVGNQTLLLNGGAIGYAIFLYFILFFLYRYYIIYKIYNIKSMFIFICGLLALFTIHSTSRMIFGYSLNVETAISLSLFFFFSDYFLKKPFIIQNENNSYHHIA